MRALKAFLAVLLWAINFALTEGIVIYMAINFGIIMGAIISGIIFSGMSCSIYYLISREEIFNKPKNWFVKNSEKIENSFLYSTIKYSKMLGWTICAALLGPLSSAVYIRLIGYESLDAYLLVIGGAFIFTTTWSLLYSGLWRCLGWPGLVVGILLVLLLALVVGKRKKGEESDEIRKNKPK